MKQRKPLKKESHHVRLDEGIYAAARRLKINIAALFEEALAKAVNTHRCPVCGGRVENE